MRGQGVGASEACGGGVKGRVPRNPASSWTPSRPQGSPPQPNSRASKREGLRPWVWMQLSCEL